MAWDLETRAMFASEHGPSGEFGLRAFDEVNVRRAAGNCGWLHAAGAPGITAPPSGMAFWRGDLLVATLAGEALVRINLERNGGRWRPRRIERSFAESARRGRYGRLRDAVAGPDGALCADPIIVVGVAVRASTTTVS